MLEPQNTFVQIAASIVQCRKFLLTSLSLNVFICLLVLPWLPKQYNAKITFIPVLAIDPNRDASLHNTVLALSILNGKSTERTIAVLKSRVLKEEIAKKLELMKVYKTATITEAAEILNGYTKIETIEGGNISIEVADQSPQRAANIANEYGNQLDYAQEKYQLISLKILDTAIPAVKSIRPRKGMIIFWAVFLTLLLDLIVLYSYKFIVALKEQSPDGFKKLQCLQTILKNDFQSVLFWRRHKDRHNGHEKDYANGRYFKPWRNAKMLEPAPKD